MLPHSIDAEESIISTLLVDSSVLVDIASTLQPSDFYASRNATIYAAMLKLFECDTAIDLVTLSNHLRAVGDIDIVGGSTGLAKTMDTVPVAADIKKTVEIIKDNSVRRALIIKANETIKLCSADDGDAKTALEYAEKSIFELSTSTAANDAVFVDADMLSDCIDEIENRMKNKGQLTGVPSGFASVDNITSGFQKSDLIILAARPAMGKTAFALNIARNAAVATSEPVMFFSLEMSLRQLTTRLLCAESRIDSSKIRSGYLNRSDLDKLNAAATRLYDARICIDDNADITATEIRSKCRKMKMNNGLGLVIIDYLQLMRAAGKYERKDLEISYISRSLKIMAKELDVPVIALSQLNRKLEERADKRPHLADLRESGALEQDADVVAFIYRDEVYNTDENNPNRGTAEILFAKHRNGAVGTATLAFLKSCTKFEDLANY